MTIKAIIFDFDGVIAESMNMKADAFAHVFRGQPEDIMQKIITLHLNQGGLSRYEKFRIIYRDYLNKSLDKHEEERLGQEFGDFCFEKSIKVPYVNGVEDFIKNNYQNYMFFIASGTPHKEINKVVDGRELRKFFRGVWGSPRSKGELTKMILKEYNLKKDEVVFVGDAPTDYQGAKEAGVKFIARIPPKGHNPFQSDEFKIDYKIEDLTTLNERLKEIDI